MKKAIAPGLALTSLAGEEVTNLPRPTGVTDLVDLAPYFSTAIGDFDRDGCENDLCFWNRGTISFLISARQIYSIKKQTYFMQK
jgi:hypothetical protein